MAHAVERPRRRDCGDGETGGIATPAERGWAAQVCSVWWCVLTTYLLPDYQLTNSLTYLSVLTSSYPDHFLFLYRTNTVIWIVARPMCHESAATSVLARRACRRHGFATLKGMSRRADPALPLGRTPVQARPHRLRSKRDATRRSGAAGRCGAAVFGQRVQGRPVPKGTQELHQLHMSAFNTPT